MLEVDCTVTTVLFLFLYFRNHNMDENHGQVDAGHGAEFLQIFHNYQEIEMPGDCHTGMFS